MRAAHEIRPCLHKGRYLFFNPLLRAAMTAADGLLGCWPRRSASLNDLRPRRILVCMQAHIGDAIMASSVFPVLRAAYPEAEFGVLIHPGSRAVMAGVPGIRWVHVVNHIKLNRSARPAWQKWREHLHSRRTARREIRATGYDLAIDLYAYFPNSAALLHGCGVPVRIGWASGGLGPLYTHPVEWPQHEAERPVVAWHQQLLGQLPACVPHLALARPSLTPLPDDRHRWQARAAELGVPPTPVIFHVGAGAPFKSWPLAQWQALLGQCLARQWPVVIMGLGEADQQLARALVAHAGGSQAAGRVFDLVGLLDWGTMVAGIAEARLLVGLDSSAVHVAAAVGTPVVCVATGVNAAAWRPVGPRACTVVSPVPCTPCHLPGGCEGMECLRHTTAATVDAQVIALTRVAEASVQSQPA